MVEVGSIGSARVFGEAVADVSGDSVREDLGAINFTEL